LGTNYDIILIICTIILTAIISLTLQAKFKNKKTRKKSEKGIQLENEAANFLKKKGYKILSHHKNLFYSLKENNKEIKIQIETDYTVSKNGRDFLVEVKSGENTSTIKYANTRRQLLEYYCASNYEGYLLVDMHNKTITEIEFPFKQNDTYAFIKIISIVLFAILIGCIGFLPEKFIIYPLIIISIWLITRAKSIYLWLHS